MMFYLYKGGERILIRHLDNWYVGDVTNETIGLSGTCGSWILVTHKSLIGVTPAKLRRRSYIGCGSRPALF